MKTITLIHPIEIKAKETGELLESISSVPVRRLKTGDLLSAIDAAGGDDKPGTLLRYLTSRATRLTLKQVDDLELDDGVQIFEAVESFLPNSLRTGRIASNSSQGHSDTPPTSDGGDRDN